MNSKTLDSLLHAICNDDLVTVTTLCKKQTQFRGSFFPNPLSVALRTERINVHIVQELLNHGIRPSSADKAIIASLEPGLSLPLATTPSRFQSMLNWFRGASLSSSQCSSLWRDACIRGDQSLGAYLFSLTPIKTPHFQYVLDHATQRQQQDVITSLPYRSLNTPNKHALLLFAAKNNYPQSVNHFLEAQKPKKHGFVPNLIHSVTGFFKGLMYGRPSTHLKKALFIATQHHNLEVVETLLDTPHLTLTKKEKGNLLKTLFEAPSHSAEKTEKLTEVILNKLSINPAEGNNVILLFAIEKGSIGAVTALLKDPRVNTLLNHNRGRGIFNALVMAINYGHGEITKNLLNAPFFNDDLAYDGIYMLVLGIAAKWGRLEIVKSLLEERRAIHPDFIYAAINTSLTIAVTYGFLEIANILLKHPNADPAIANNTMLHKAFNNGHSDIVHLLLKDARVTPSIPAESIALLALRKQNLPLLRMLLESQRTELHIDSPLKLLTSEKNPTEIGPFFTAVTSVNTKEATISQLPKATPAEMLLYAFVSQEELQTFYRSLPLAHTLAVPIDQCLQQAAYLRALFPLIKVSEQEFKPLNIETKDLIQCAEIASLSDTKKSMSQQLSTFLKQEHVSKVFREKLREATHTLHPLVSTAKYFPDAKTQEDTKLSFYKPYIAPAMIHTVSKPIAMHLFEALNQHLLSSDTDKSRDKTISSVTDNEIDRFANFLAQKLYAHKLSNEKNLSPCDHTWQHKIQEQVEASTLKATLSR